MYQPYAIHMIIAVHFYLIFCVICVEDEAVINHQDRWDPASLGLGLPLDGSGQRSGPGVRCVGPPNWVGPWYTYKIIRENDG